MVDWPKKCFSNKDRGKYKTVGVELTFLSSWLITGPHTQALCSALPNSLESLGTRLNWEGAIAVFVLLLCKVIKATNLR